MGTTVVEPRARRTGRAGGVLHWTGFLAALVGLLGTLIAGQSLLRTWLRPPPPEELRILPSHTRLWGFFPPSIHAVPGTSGRDVGDAKEGFKLARAYEDAVHHADSRAASIVKVLLLLALAVAAPRVGYRWFDFLIPLVLAFMWPFIITKFLWRLVSPERYWEPAPS